MLGTQSTFYHVAFTTCTMYTFYTGQILYTRTTYANFLFHTWHKTRIHIHLHCTPRRSFLFPPRSPLPPSLSLSHPPLLPSTLSLPPLPKHTCICIYIHHVYLFRKTYLCKACSRPVEPPSWKWSVGSSRPSLRNTVSDLYMYYRSVHVLRLCILHSVGRFF